MKFQLRMLAAASILTVLPAAETEQVPVQKTTGNLRHPSDFTPGKPKRLSFPDEYTLLTLSAEKFAQGRLIYAELISKKKEFTPEKPELRIHGRNIPLIRKSWGYRGFAGISPASKTGETPVQLNYILAGRKHARSYKLVIEKTEFEVFRTSFPVKNWSDQNQLEKKEVVEQKKRDWQKKVRTFRLNTEDKIGGHLSHPRDMHKITSPFWSKRVISRYKMEKGKKKELSPQVTIHHGTDFKGKPGTAIFAVADGKVVLAEKMFFEGNFTVIDHGNRIFTGYMHQSKLLVKEGDFVKAGQKIGEVGATGAVTGPHLHLFMRLDEVYVEPLSLFGLPVRN